MLKFGILTTCLIASALVLSACSGDAKDTHPQQLVSKRQAIFKKLTKTLEPMGLVARDRKDYSKGEFQAEALALQELSSQPWPLFAPDGNYPPTRAKPSVWQLPTEFKKAQDSYLATVEQLVKVSSTADMAAIRQAVNEVEKSCKSCHEQFRSER
ncbi:MAG: cytochrome c [Comamonadaceae bacterium]|nr:cytochrome c [Comamonadaceae bacterium]